MAKKKNGKQTKHTAAKPNAFPWPDPVDMYLWHSHRARSMRGVK